MAKKKKGKILLATDTPNKKEIEVRKRQKGSFCEMTKVEKNKRKQQKLLESESSESKSEVPHSVKEVNVTQKVEVDDLVIIKFCGEKKDEIFCWLRNR